MVIGAAALHKRFARVPENIINEIKPILEGYARQLVQEMRRLVPVKEGALRDSIGWTWGDAPAGSLSIGTFKGKNFGKIKITIYAGNSKTIVTNSRGATFQNALIQEFGGKKRDANPYFYVTIRANKSRVRAGTTRAIRRGIKKS